MKKEYIKKTGEKNIYTYSDKKYNDKRNKTICNLQKLKSYYKKTGNLEKMQSCQILINIEKRKNGGKKNEENI